MRIVFVANSNENLGVESLSAVLRRAGHVTALVYDPQTFNSNKGLNSALLHRWFGIRQERVARRVAELAPDLVAVSSYTYDYQWCLEVARLVKQALPNVPIVFGGYHPTLVPEVVVRSPWVDAAVVGEGEGPLLDLVACLEGGRFRRTDIPNVHFKGPEGGVVGNPIRPYLHDLDALPFPDKTLFYDKVPALEEDYIIVTDRGCPFTCSFCCLNYINKIYAPIDKHYVRQRSVDHVLEELRWARRRGRARYVSFWDAIFGTDVRWLEEFAPRYRAEIGLPFYCMAHPNTITEEKARLLAEAGCAHVKIGLQSTNTDTLREVRRPGTLEKIVEGCRQLRRFGLSFSVDHILGLPGDGEEDLIGALRLYNDIRPSRINTFWLVYFPKTDMVEVGKRAGALDEAMVRKIEQGQEVYHVDFLKMNFYHHRSELERLRTMANLLPLVPRRVFSWLLDHRIYRTFIWSNLFHQILTGVRDLFYSDTARTVAALRYMFERKAVP